MRVAIFTAFNAALNPYIILFKKALESQGLKVDTARNLNIYWLLLIGKPCDCIHLHWIKYCFFPTKKNDKSKLLKKLIALRPIKVLADLICLLDFIAALIFAKMLGKYIVFTVHDLHDFEIKSYRSKLQLEIARNIVFRLSDKIHVHNYYTRELVENRYKRKAGIKVIPHGNYIGYYKNTVTKSEARQLLGVTDENFVYLFLGLIRPYKGIEELVKSFKKLEDKEIRLFIAGRVFGNYEYKYKIEKLCEDDKRIIFVPEFIADDDIQVYLNACDIYVLPYKDITTSGAALLSISFGRPLIAPDIKTFIEVVTQEIGIIYNASKSSGIDSALRRAKKMLWSEEKIFEYAHQFDWDKLKIHLNGLYS